MAKKNDILILEKGLSFSFSGEDLFHIPESSESLNVQGGKIYGIFGPNGSGKTTFLNLINGFLCPQKGKIEYFYKGKGPFFYEEKKTIVHTRSYFNKDTPIRIASFPVRRIFQIPALADEFNLVEALIIARRDEAEESIFNYLNPLFFLRRCSKNAVSSRAEAVELLKEFEFLDPDQKVGTLSYGEKRIITLLQMIHSRANILFLDEPFANLNIKVIEKLKIKLREFVNKENESHAIILIEHRKEHLVKFVDCIWYISNREIVVENRK